MDSQANTTYSFTPFHWGVDWLTVTAPADDEGLPFARECEHLRDEERVAGGDVQPATLRDYVGHRGRGFFVGTRRDDRICILSGGLTPARFLTIAQTATNCSRLDLQVSVWTNGEQPEFAREQYQRLKALPPSRGRPRSLTLIQSHPQGETLNVGKRVSDNYGRVYDWSSAHKAGEPRTVWRFEVEYKRHEARRQLAQLVASPNHRERINHQVHSWFSKRQLIPPWPADDTHHSDGTPLLEPERDTLAWLRSSVSKTVRNMIDRHGIEAVLLALGLSDKVAPIERRKRRAFTRTNRPL